MRRRPRAGPGPLGLRVEVGADARADRRPRVAVATRPIAIASGVSHAESLRPSPMGSRNAAPSQFSALPRLTSLELALPRPAAACWYDDLVGIYGPLSRAPQATGRIRRDKDRASCAPLRRPGRAVHRP